MYTQASLGAGYAVHICDCQLLLCCVMRGPCIVRGLRVMSHVFLLHELAQ